MEELLGFIVLTGPLFLVLLWAPICIVFGFWFGHKKYRHGKKMAGFLLGTILTLLAIVLPISDEITGRLYFKHLCETKARTNIYKAIEIPATYWDNNGKQTFFDEKNGNLWLPLDQYAYGKSENTKLAFNIEERHSILFEKQTGNLVSKEIWFLFWGGWIKNNFSPHNSALRCGDDGVKRSIDLYSKIFKPTPN